MKTLTYAKLALLLALPFATGCIQQSMSNQPKFKPLQPTNLFPDGRSSRPPEFGTISRTWRDDPHLLTGLKPDAAPLPAEAPPLDKVNEAAGKAFLDRFATTFPFPMSKERLERGQQRFNIFCSVCHGYAGSGDGMIVKRGFTKPPSLIGDATEEKLAEIEQTSQVIATLTHDLEDLAKKIKDGKEDKKPLEEKQLLLNERLAARTAHLALLESQLKTVAKENYSRGIAYQGLSVALPDAPVGYYYHVMTSGYGAMPEHATQIPVEDRWAIAGYLRVLQKSQHATVADLPADIKANLDKKKDEKKEGHP